jgi:hypothetical protein
MAGFAFSKPAGLPIIIDKMHKIGYIHALPALGAVMQFSQPKGRLI